MKFIYHFLLGIFFIILLGCGPNNGNGSINNCLSVDKYLIGFRKSPKQIAFELDSLTSPNISYSKLITINDTLYFSFLNSYTNTVYVYSYENYDIVRKFKLDSEKKLTGYEIIDWNNIISYEYWNNIMSLHNNSGEILQQIDIPKIENGYYSLPSTKTPLIHSDGNIYMTGGHMTSSRAGNEAIVSIVDTNLREVNYDYQFPEIYKNNFFGGSHYRMDISYDYNQDSGIFVFSFPASHSVFATSNFTNQKEFCAASDAIEEIPSYPYDDIDKTFEFASENGFYYSICYDKYRKLYYRTCLMPVKQQEDKKYRRDMSIIILDRNFSKVGEVPFKIDEDFYMTSLATILVSSDGLMIKKKNEPGDESKIEFFIYEPYEL